MVEKRSYKNIWVYIETDQQKVRSVSLELLNAGRGLLQSDEILVAILIGNNLSDCAKEAIAYGADQAIVIEAEEYEDYSTDGYTNVLVQLITSYRPSAILFGATCNGKDLAPRVACRLKTGLTADCTAISIDNQSNHILWIRPAFSGNLMAEIVCPAARPQMGTIRSGVFKKAGPDYKKKGDILYHTIRTPKEMIRTKLIDFIFPDTISDIDLNEAEIIVAGGRGLGQAKNFRLLRDLADLLGAAVGASRAPVDAGWIDHIYQIGQTGKTVNPKIYLACGISGSMQHLAGIASSETIIAINSDSESPIFKIADYGIVGDLFEVIPALIKEIKHNRV
jgi:electron transfer flavoprotein alpha subunit